MAVWERTETLAQLNVLYGNNEITDASFIRINNEFRKAEWLTVRILLRQLVGEKVNIEYEPTGKPYLKGIDKNIAITHSKYHVGILIADHCIPGLDIEHISDRVGKVAHKFLTNFEQTWCTTQLLQTAAWSAKESVFKMVGQGLDFKDIELAQFSADASQFLIEATIKRRPTKEISLNGWIINHDVLTFGFY